MFSPAAMKKRQGQRREITRIARQSTRPNFIRLERSTPQKGEVETKTPKIHELVIMDDADGLTMWLEIHPGDIELRFHLKSPLLVAVKCNSWKCFQILMRKNANMEEYNTQNETALVIAARHKRMEMVKKTIEQWSKYIGN